MQRRSTLVRAALVAFAVVGTLVLVLAFLYVAVLLGSFYLAKPG